MINAIRVIVTAEQGQLTYEYPNRPAPTYVNGIYYAADNAAHRGDTYLRPGLMWDGDGLYGYTCRARYGGRVSPDFAPVLCETDSATERARKLVDRIAHALAWAAELDRHAAAKCGDVIIALDAPSAVAMALDAGRTILVLRTDGSTVKI